MTTAGVVPSKKERGSGRSCFPSPASVANGGGRAERGGQRPPIRFFARLFLEKGGGVWGNAPMLEKRGRRSRKKVSEFFKGFLLRQYGGYTGVQSAKLRKKKCLEGLIMGSNNFAHFKKKSAKLGHFAHF